MPLTKERSPEFDKTIAKANYAKLQELTQFLIEEMALARYGYDCALKLHNKYDEEYTEKIAAATAEIESEYQPLLKETSDSVSAWLNEETELREDLAKIAKRMLELDPNNKTPHDAMKIAVYSDIEFTDERYLVEWCYNHLITALRIHYPTIKSAITSGVPINHIDMIASTKDDVRIQISKDLSDYLPDGGKKHSANTLK